MEITKRYVKGLSEKDKIKQYKLIKKSKKLYNNRKYYVRPKIKSYKHKKSNHVIKAKKMYNINKITASSLLARKTKCSKKGLSLIIKKGKGAYYSSGSRPSQTPHSWGRARLASAITGGKSSGVDLYILKKYCKPSSKALKIAKTVKQGLKKTKKEKIYMRGGYKKEKNIVFKDYPNFTPNLSPRSIFKMGSFGGAYWRPIYSRITKKKYKKQHKKYPKSWWKNIPENMLSSPVCDIQKNKYKVKVGTSLKFWENKNWITKYHPYGWIQWYCDFYLGKRSSDDKRQIDRWLKLAGPNGRFRKWLINLIKKKKGKWNDYKISPKIRQTLQHWGYILTYNDFKN
tara:strand:+ start:5736 stop:6761 length:1026 start_codon:yes stop_codon:yes gene_type:complete